MPRPEKIPQMVKYKFLLGMIDRKQLRQLLEVHGYVKGQASLVISMLTIKKYSMEKEEMWLL